MTTERPDCRVHLRALISGRVQGVSFRANTARQARRLGITGIARNLADGRVEVIAAGSADALVELVRWLQHGPRFARVDAVQTEDLPVDSPSPDEFTTA